VIGQLNNKRTCKKIEQINKEIFTTHLFVNVPSNMSILDYIFDVLLR